MSTLLVLGGADGAISTLRAAARLGLRAACADMRADAPALRHASEFLHVSTRDVPGLLAALSGRSDIVGVLSPASDVNLPSQLAVARRLGLPCGLSDDAVRASVDKGFFRDLCDGLGLPGPRHAHGPPDEVAPAVPGLRPPLIVKPVDSSGGRGISGCAAAAEVAAAVEAALRWSAAGRVIVEEYLAGDHYTAEAVVDGGRVALMGLAERVLTPPPHFVTAGHAMPGGEPGLAAEVRRMLDLVCAALDYRHGCLNADVLVTPDGDVVLIEVGTRLGGNGVPELLGLVTGIDVVEAQIRMAIGERPRLAPRPGAHAAVRVLGSRREGRLAGLGGTREIRALPGVADLVLSAAPGDHVEPLSRAGAKLGYVVAGGPDRASVRAVLDQADRLLRVELADLPAGEPPP
ncbi:carbamoyl phosphate synthase [Sphaerisporangium rufum]|uniref:Carbamoyl phosphate synthase n=1 Tax=Sphaerisporangium rufum TaxID=1381558 RepID=A0A919R798_9ACTN|nr:ATP-grasp domain-containing protein [Sphaerisporangium rufum]GII78472.1 carbamoyl phosphate synthase [Sphaerisporangium rufum]